MTLGNTTSFANRYQSVLVPVIFEPWAREMIRRAAPQSGEHILDLACGTGVVIREVARTVPVPGSLTAVDHSAEMLGVAQAIGTESGVAAEWVEADAAALPFEDDRFDVTFCQQALQFFPDRPAALRELRRVSRPGARVAFCVQRELAVNPMLAAQAAALDVHVGPQAGDAVRAICGLPDSEVLRELFEETGFDAVEVEPVSLTLRHPDARTFAEGAMGGMHTGDKLAGLADERVGRAVDAFLDGLRGYMVGPSMEVPHRSNVVVARA